MSNSKGNPKHGLRYHPLYSTWANMIHRTTNDKDPRFLSYGGRGIIVCDRWTNVALFIEDMYPSFKEGMTLDRIDNNGNYEISNCRWASKTTQACNTRVLRKDNKSGFRGVGFNKASSKWMASIRVNNKSKYIGVFETPLEAAIAYNNYVTNNNLEHTLNKV